METKIKLLMTFKDTDGKKVSITVDSPKDDIMEAEILDVMNLIVEKDVFAPNDVRFEDVVSAKVVETNTTEHDLEL